MVGDTGLSFRFASFQTARRKLGPAYYAPFRTSDFYRVKAVEAKIESARVCTSFCEFKVLCPLSNSANNAHSAIRDGKVAPEWPP
jgi:hypothetical protein